MRDRRFLVVLLGASEFARMGLPANVAFANSASAFADYLQNSADGPGQYVVRSFFDTEEALPDLAERLSETLRLYRDVATDLIVYYVGHGGFFGKQDYFLALRRTKHGLEDTSALQAGTLARIVRHSFGEKHVYVILDCCFAGEAVSAFQADGSIGEPVAAMTMQHFARSGTALLVASSKDEPALTPPGAEFTMFSDALLSVLIDGIETAGEYLSLHEVGTAAQRLLADRYPPHVLALPEVHTPRQRGVDVAMEPLFPNMAGRPRRARPSPEPPPPPDLAERRLLDETERHDVVRRGEQPRPGDWQRQVERWRCKVASIRPEPVVMVPIGPVTQHELIEAKAFLAGRLLPAGDPETLQTDPTDGELGHVV